MGFFSMFLYTLFQKRLKRHSPESPVLAPQLIVGWIFFIHLFAFFVFLFYVIFIYLFIFSFLLFACFFCLFVLWLLIFLFFIGLFCSCVLLSLFSFSFWHGDFISLWVGLGLIFHWSENKISYLGALYKFLNVGIDFAVIIELFIILYI